MAYSGEVVAIAAQTDRAKPYPLAVGVGYVCGLVLVNIGLTLTANWLDWTLYTLVRDLRWAAMVLWGILLLWAILASFSTRGREARLPLGHLLDGSPWPRSARRVWMGLLGVAAAAVLLPLIPSSPRGLSLHSGPPGESTGEGPSPRYVTQLAFDGTSDAWSRGRPSVDLAGWVYAPLSGPYHFELTAVGSRSSRWTVLRFWGSEIRRRRSGYPGRRIRPAPAGRRRISWQGFTGSCSPTGHRTMSCTPCSAGLRAISQGPDRSQVGTCCRTRHRPERGNGVTSF